MYLFICLSTPAFSQTKRIGKYAVNDSLKTIFKDNYNAENFSVKLNKHLFIGAQNVSIYQHQAPLKAKYDGPISIKKKGDDQFLVTTTLNFLFSFWKNSELVISPESQLGNGIGNGKGVGAYPNAMYGYPQIMPYILRAHYRHHFYFKNKKLKEYNITAGRYVIQEMFDTSPYDSDPKKDFLNFSHTMLNAWDVAATSYGYTHGFAQAFIFKKAAFYSSVNTHNLEAGGSKTDWDIAKAYSINLQLVKNFKLFGKEGKVRLLGFYNRYNGGDYKHYYIDTLDKQAYFDSTHTYTNKYGGGVDINYRLTNLSGFFIRYSINDGLHEDFGYTQCDGSLNTGFLLKMTRINRPMDKIGISASVNTISPLHRNFLRDGGVGFMIGDGKLTYLPENVFELFYAINFKNHVYITANYQYMANVGYNANRGNAHFLSLRLNLVL